MKQMLKIGLLASISLYMACNGNDTNTDTTNNDNTNTTTIELQNDVFESVEDTKKDISSFLENDTFSKEMVTITTDATSKENASITKSGDTYFYTPPKSFVGTDTFNYTVCKKDDNTICKNATVTIKVLDQGTPKAVADSYETTKNTGVTISDFLDNDTLIDDAVLKNITTTATKGTAVLNANGSINYTPKTDFIGEDTLSYTICDDDSPKTCATATITIVVKNANGSQGGFNIPAALISYYKDVDFSLTKTALKDDLAITISNTHTTNLSYTPGVWNVLKEADLDPTNNAKILLIYGYSDTDGNYVTDRTRDKNETGGSQGSDWNREHVYAQSLGIPALGKSGPGADAHHLRASDVKMNSNRGSKKFANGSGNAGNSSGGWYPGNEWKGDVARMMLYMYIRYGNQCLPKNVAIGNTNTIDSNMVNLLLEWNEEDPVSDFEKNRNTVIYEAQGNRNPFIDNPYLATVIWGGTAAENTWK